MRIVLDAMGSDTYPDPEVQAAIEAASLYGDEILLVGHSEQLTQKLNEAGGSNKVKIIHAPEVLEMTDKPSRSARGKAENSMAVGMELLRSGDGDAFVTITNDHQIVRLGPGGTFSTDWSLNDFNTSGSVLDTTGIIVLDGMVVATDRSGTVQVFQP